MEALTREKYNELYSLGKDFAFDGMSPEQFKSNSPEEKKAFLEGYKEGIMLMQQSLKENTGEKRMAA